MTDDIACPWCRADLRTLPAADTDEQTCPECLTSWTWVASEPAVELRPDGLTAPAYSRISTAAPA